METQFVQDRHKNGKLFPSSHDKYKYTVDKVRLNKESQLKKR